MPWPEYESDALRLDVHNGLLLSALWDAAFDCGLISFADDGTVLRSTNLTLAATTTLNLDTAPPLKSLTDLHRANQSDTERGTGIKADEVETAPRWLVRRGFFVRSRRKDD